MKLSSYFYFLLLFVVHGYGNAAVRQERIYHDAPVVMTDSVLRIPIAGYSYLIDVEARAVERNVGQNQGMAENYWGLSMVGNNDTITVSIRHGNTDYGDFLDRRISRVSVTRNSESLYSKDFEQGFSSASSRTSYNTLSLHFSHEDNMLRVSGGGRNIMNICSLATMDNFAPDHALLWSVGGLTTSLFCIETTADISALFTTGWTEERIKETISSSTDPAVGYWYYLDRQNHPDYAMLGGKYMLAVVNSPEQPDLYDIIYLGGATTYGDRWKPMMLKGHLRKTAFLNHYDLEWIDSSFNMISDETFADFSDNMILTFSFPLLKSTIRFAKHTAVR